MACKCKNNLDRFCYICSNVVLPYRQAKITDFEKKAYHDYFGVKLEDQDKLFAPHVCCKKYAENLRDWRNGKRKSVPFAIPVAWREGKDHLIDCYFCMMILKRIIARTSTMSNTRMFHSSHKINPLWSRHFVFLSQMVTWNITDSGYCDMTVLDGNDAYKPEEDVKPVSLTQAEFNDLTRNLNLSNESALLTGFTFARARPWEKIKTSFHIPG